jgi:hypothetical protein
VEYKYGGFDGSILGFLDKGPLHFLDDQSANVGVLEVKNFDLESINFEVEDEDLLS